MIDRDGFVLDIKAAAMRPYDEKSPVEVFEHRLFREMATWRRMTKLRVYFTQDTLYEDITALRITTCYIRRPGLFLTSGVAVRNPRDGNDNHAAYKLALARAIKNLAKQIAKLLPAWSSADNVSRAIWNLVFEAGYFTPAKPQVVAVVLDELAKVTA